MSHVIGLSLLSNSERGHAQALGRKQTAFLPVPETHQLAAMVAGTESKEQVSIDILRCGV